MKNNSYYLIIGSSVAGVAAAESIRKYDQKNSLTIITADTFPAFSRPLISYWLEGKVSDKDMFFQPEGFFSRKRIILRTGEKVQRINFARKLVFTSRDNYRYQKLLIASGTSPVIPEIPGKDLALTFTGFSEVQKIKKNLSQIKSVVIAGAGFIGLKAAEAIKKHNKEVTIVELQDRVLPTLLDDDGAAIYQRHLTKHGIKIILRTAIQKIARHQNQYAVSLSNEKKISADLVIMAVGVKPRIDFIPQNTLKINRAIVVNKYLQTSQKDVYAAGDCTMAPELLSGQSGNIAIWPVAYRQGKIAGANMTGEKIIYEGSLAMNSVEVFGLPLISVGKTLANPGEVQIIKSYRPEKMTYKKLLIQNNRLVGAIFINDIDRAGIYTGLIREKVDLTNFDLPQLLKENFGFISVPSEVWKKKINPVEVE